MPGGLSPAGSRETKGCFQQVSTQPDLFREVTQKGEHDLDRWREQGGLQRAFRTQSHGLGPLLQLCSFLIGTPRTMAAMVSRCRVLPQHFQSIPFRIWMWGLGVCIFKAPK